MFIPTPDLDDYNDEDGDELILYLADVLQLVEAALPKIKPSEIQHLAPAAQKSWSKRMGLWKIKPESEYFRKSFREHTVAQRAAEEAGNYAEASHHAKTKTKECRYSVPAGALNKAFRQKVVLEECRGRAVAEAAQTGNSLVQDALEDLPIFGLREKMIEKEPENAQAAGFP